MANREIVKHVPFRALLEPPRPTAIEGSNPPFRVASLSSSEPIVIGGLNLTSKGSPEPTLIRGSDPTSTFKSSADCRLSAGCNVSAGCKVRVD